MVSSCFLRGLLATLLFIAPCHCTSNNTTGTDAAVKITDPANAATVKADAAAARAVAAAAAAEAAKDRQWIVNSTFILQRVMRNYDSSMAPYVPGKPVEVVLVLEILAFGEIDEANMEYGLDLYFLQVWTDIRLAKGQNRTFSFSGKDIGKVWTPDTYFMNAKKTEIKDVMKDNQMVYIMSNGLVVQMSRITLKVACHLQLQMYPFDRQKCELVIESFSLTEDKLVYSWGNLVADNCVVQVFDDAMAQYEYKGVNLSYQHNKVISAGFSNLYATFVFDRRTAYTVVQVFIPSYMIVILSFMALWIPQDAVPARVALGITTVLTVVYFLGTVNSNMPRVSYMKAIDCHLFVSFGFVFATIMEYVILLNVPDRPKRKMPSEDKYELCPLKNHSCDEPTQKNSYRASIEVRYCATNNHSYMEDGGTPVLAEKARKKRPEHESSVHRVDKVARVLFPACYGLFVVTYWVVCATLSPQREELKLC